MPTTNNDKQDVLEWALIAVNTDRQNRRRYSGDTWSLIKESVEKLGLSVTAKKLRICQNFIKKRLEKLGGMEKQAKKKLDLPGYAVFELTNKLSQCPAGTVQIKITTYGMQAEVSMPMESFHWGSFVKGIQEGKVQT